MKHLLRLTQSNYIILLIRKLLNLNLEIIFIQLLKATGDVIVQSRPEVGETLFPNFKPDSWEVESAILPGDTQCDPPP